MFDTAQSHGLWFLNNHVSVEVPAASNTGGLSVLMVHAPFDEGPPLHVHHEEDEIFFIVEGEVRFVIGSRTVVARKGDTLLAPLGIPHAYRVISPEGAQILAIARANFEAMVLSVARPAAAVTLPDPVVPTAECQAQLAAACAAQGIEILGPPID